MSVRACVRVCVRVRVCVHVYDCVCVHTFVLSLLCSSAERNNWMFRLFECFVFVSLFKASYILIHFNSLFACFLLHNGYLTKDFGF